jgi:hypothetical protein
MGKITRLHLIILCFLFLTPVAKAQKTATVSGQYTYVITENDDVTLNGAKQKCIELAKAACIKAEFGEMVTSDVIDSNTETNGQESSSYFWENTVAMAKGEWLGDTKPTELDVAYKDGKLTFTAKVYGKIREIIQAKVDLKWDIQKDGVNGRRSATTFDSGERIYVNLRSPSAGYVAVYLIVGDDETSCLLPYPNDFDGRYPIKANRDYVFFDKSVDQTAYHYKLSTKRKQEDNQIVVIFSPNPFTKCNDITGDKYHPNSLSTHDFQKWLLKCQRKDKDMVVDKKWIKIYQKNNN